MIVERRPIGPMLASVAGRFAAALAVIVLTNLPAAAQTGRGGVSGVGAAATGIPSVAGTAGASTAVGATNGTGAATGALPTAADAGTIGLSAETAFAGGIDRSLGLATAAGTVGVAPELQTGAARTPLGGAGGGFGGAGFGRGLGGLGGLANLFGGQNNQASDTPPPLRTKLRSAVVGPVLTPTQTRLSADRSIRRASNLNPASPSSPTGRRFTGIAVDVRDRTATINGQVNSAADRRMAELLLRLEPGVSRVQNNVTLRDQP